jgi:hypothetical protein
MAEIASCNTPISLYTCVFLKKMRLKRRYLDSFFFFFFLKNKASILFSNAQYPNKTIYLEDARIYKMPIYYLQLT